MADFTNDPEARKLIERIVNRGMGLAEQAGSPRDRMSMMMDLCAAHGCNGNAPLDLKALAEADDFNLAHDVFGIEAHIDRVTGQIMGFFVPRFARPAPVAA